MNGGARRPWSPYRQPPTRKHVPIPDQPAGGSARGQPRRVQQQPDLKGSGQTHKNGYIVQARPETVASQRSETFATYALKGTGHVLATGRAVGEKIAAGQVRVVSGTHDLAAFRPGEVLVSDTTSPDWEPVMKTAAAIVTRELGVPAVVGAGNATEALKPASMVTVSCAEGETGRVYEGKIPFETTRVATTTLARPRTAIMVNLGNPDLAFRTAMLPNEGVGLARMDKDGTRRMSGGKTSKCGTPQGGVASPLLANIYMNRFLKYWRLSGCGEAFRAHVVSYADDFVILSRGHAAEALAWTKAVMTKLGLTINEAKTSLKDARKERFDFLGYSFGPHWFKKNGKWYLGASPSKKSMQRFKTKVGETLVPANVAPWEDVRDQLNSMLLGWSHYFSYGATASAYKHVDWHVYQRARDYLTRRHKVQGRGTAQFSCDVVYGELGIIRLERLPRSYAPWAAREASRRA